MCINRLSCPSLSVFAVFGLWMCLLVFTLPHSLVYAQSPSFRTLEKSELLQKSGSVQVGKRFPFFATWQVTNQQNQLQSLPKLLKNHQAHRYVIMSCAFTCLPCKEKLKELSALKDQFQKTKTQLLIFVANSEDHAKKLNTQFNLEWAIVLTDVYLRLAKEWTVHSKRPHGIELSKTFVLDQKGVVLHILGQEGRDFRELILGKTKSEKTLDEIGGRK